MWTQIMRYSDPFLRLKRSKFRRNIFLDERERNIHYTYGEDIVREHARKIVEERMKEPNSLYHVQFRGHPVFKAMHATATCCRNCLFRWHRIPRYRALEQHEIDFIINMIMTWIRAKAA